MSDDLTPKPDHKFAFGLWTIGNLGRDPFGEATRPPIDPVDFIRGLAEIGAAKVGVPEAVVAFPRTLEVSL